VGLSGSPVAWAARGLGHSRRLARARRAGPGPRRRPPGLPPARQLVSSARARPVTRCRRARAPRFDRPQCLCVEVSVCPYMARARPAYIDPAVCVSVCIYIYVCLYVCLYVCMAPVGHADLYRCRWPGGLHVRVCIYICGCLYIYMDGCHRRAMPTYVETDDHVRVSAGVRMWRARSTGPSRARAALRCR
jgi:hypothetical protein